MAEIPRKPYLNIFNTYYEAEKNNYLLLKFPSEKNIFVELFQRKACVLQNCCSWDNILPALADGLWLVSQRRNRHDPDITPLSHETATSSKVFLPRPLNYLAKKFPEKRLLKPMSMIPQTVLVAKTTLRDYSSLPYFFFIF